MNTIAYHIDSIPEGMTIEEILEIYFTTKVLIYKDIKPYSLDNNNLDTDNIIIVKKNEWEMLSGM